MGSPLLGYFGSELRAEREVAGVTQKQLAEAVLYSESKVGAVERGEQLPSLAFCQRADDFLSTNGRYTRMRAELLTAEVTPEWFRSWVDCEREATYIGWFEPLLIPGLLQTEEYATALLQDEALLAARMERQQILEKASVKAIIDESVLHRQIGDRRTMAEQLDQLTTARATVQVLPSEADTYVHLEGSFALAAIDGAEVGYVETPTGGFTIDKLDIVAGLRRRWETILAEALPRGQSKALIIKVAERWKSEL